MESTPPSAEAKMAPRPQALTVAGSDSGGGAGIQADLKTFAMHGVFGASVITALTAQNSRGVSGIHAPEPQFVARQLSAVLDDLSIGAAKTGMLFSRDIIAAVAPLLREWGGALVVDPVCVAASGDRLLETQAVESLVAEIIPLAALLTPNRHEAELLTGMRVETREQCFAACAKLLEMGPGAVLLKGGHFDEAVAVTDWLALPGQEPIPMIQPRVDTKNVHGTGCTLSAAIAANLALGEPLARAVAKAQAYVNLGLRASFTVGQGPGPVHHGAVLTQARARAEILDELIETARMLEKLPGLARLLPRFGGNIAAALPFASDPAQVAAFEVPLAASADGHIFVPGCPRFGAAPELGVRLAAASASGSGAAWAMPLRLAEATLRGLERAGLLTASVDHGGAGAEERAAGDDFDWDTLRTLQRAVAEGARVDALIDTSGDFPGPTVILLARDALELAEKLDAVAEGAESVVSEADADTFELG
ncbi:phosphomethylpyrimidine kinase [Alkalidesulfovibrio alkalitolerans DSM 16529]|uniref:hydroxymethylpyrimidine kinase n=1 Tax=Alkalidesulfovibrio alkalitolerans DSM 16529 TaxID=1121439 RepID=S7TEC8_9BACT|nr:bifunctional hydroxymethylpyrimidine kinase/phosphomethylpyrimidine kinase [Alkalidesulfovibrio alkalitolerans]EPR34935.1 phosphomethylpyrimidine kinase [Alkalidesulfovibrio alkalitolerans DSM 16529]